MIATAMVVMYVLTYLNSAAFEHVRFSEERFYMVLIMGASMAIVMLGFMLGMYRNTTINLSILAGSVLVFLVALSLVRSQATIQDRAYMNSMIPHHSIAILTSERSQITDVRVCELAVGIIEAQRREIDEMEWLLADIADHGPAETAAEAAARPIPDFTGEATRTCGDG
ncbi:MAG: DUF305 domain-containing protein [Acidimicrobiia bacterium]|nr:DUF305 domain-containing protein [Acidimicrobiia bacterium]